MIGIGRAYSVNFENQTIANASGDYDLFSIVPASDKICVVEALYLSNVGGTADAGDAQEELLRLQFLRMTGTVTFTGGTSNTPPPLSTNDTAASFTAKTVHSSVATTSGSSFSMHADGWNVRVPYVWLPPPEHRILVSVSTAAFLVRLNSTVNDDIAVSGTLIVRELP